jgi:hypothetical protein
MAGRPLKFQSVEELQAKIDDYFASIELGMYLDKDGVPSYPPVTITGLALHLGCYRETITNYEDRDEFFHTIKTAKLRVENFAEQQLFKARNPTGAIFALKNYGWDDKNITEHQGGLGITFVDNVSRTKED